MLNEVKHPRGVGILRFAQNDKTPRNPEEPFFCSICVNLRIDILP